MASMAGGIAGSAQTDITNPYEAQPCGCVYCYGCLATRLEAENGEGVVCLRCAEVITSGCPWSGDVLASTSRPGSGKSVSFADEPTETQEQLHLTNDEAHDSGYQTADEVRLADKYG